MKNIWTTVIVGFIAGLVISGILFDVIVYIGKSFNRATTAWTVSKAEKAFSQERFSDAVLLYEKALKKVNPDNKILLAKTKNNLALSIYKNAEVLKETEDIQKAIELFKEAEFLYTQTGDKILAGQSTKNIKIAEELIK